VLADTVDANQSTPFKVGFELVLAGFVFFGGQLLTERVPSGDEGRTQGVVVGHEHFEFRAGLADMHHERGFVMHDVVGISESHQHSSDNRFVILFMTPSSQSLEPPQTLGDSHPKQQLG
jgi:hypothetical protein